LSKNMRGRKPELKAIDGGLSRLPPAPSWLPGEAKVEWRRVVSALKGRRTMTKADLPMLESYCLAAGMVRRAQAAIAEQGDTVTTKNGTRRHPAFQTLFQALTESRRLAAELGLTPASRKKAPVTDGDDGLDLDL
jgi:P27 family predicted phage terminase small subunit